MEPLMLAAMILGASLYGARLLYLNLKPLFQKKPAGGCHSDCGNCPYAGDYCNH